MSNRNLLILTAAVLGLAAFIWLFERHQPKTDERAAQANKVFGALKTEDVLALSLENPHGTFSFEKQGRAWQLVEPISEAADAAAVNGVLSSVLGLEKDRTMGPDEVDREAYGLNEPEYTLSLIDARGGRHILDVGGETPLDSKRAVSLGGPEVVLTSSWFTSSLDKDLDDWRSRDLCTVFLDDLSAIQVLSGEDRIDATRRGEQWRLSEPVEDLADEEQLRNLVTDLNGLRIQEFVDVTDDQEDLAIDKPRFRVRLLPADGSEAVELVFGTARETEDGTAVACRRNGTDLFWVGDGAETVLGKAPVRWREPSILAFETWDVQQLTIAGPYGEVSLDRTTGTWLFEDGSQADPTAVQDRLAAIHDLQAVDFDLLSLDTPEFGRLRLFLGPEDGVPTELIFYKGIGEGGNVLVETTSRNGFMSVAPAGADGIFEDLKALQKPDEPTG